MTSVLRFRISKQNMTMISPWQILSNKIERLPFNFYFPIGPWPRPHFKVIRWLLMQSFVSVSNNPGLSFSYQPDLYYTPCQSHILVNSFTNSSIFTTAFTTNYDQVLMMNNHLRDSDPLENLNPITWVSCWQKL